ncbi:sigma-70 family RNA polymerase sigma factor [Enterobacterales bacterium BD_CKDN230030183-1A_HGKHYDSX7]
MIIDVIRVISRYIPVTSATKGDLANFYLEHNLWLRGWLRKRTGCTSDAADLAQDTFLKVLTAHDALVIHKPRQFLSTIAKGLMIDQTRRRVLERAYLAALALAPPEEVPSLEVQALLFEALLEVDRALRGLGEKVRCVFLLSQVDGLTYTQIADQMKISPRTVSNYMAKAMEHCCIARLEATR